MSSVAILCNGDFPRKPYPRYLLDSADMVICCDAAAESFVLHTGREPDLTVGDMDSLTPAFARKHPGMKIVNNADQETNDLTKAVNWVMENVPDLSSLHILGANGRREDHTIGNLSLLMEFERRYALAANAIRLEAVSDWTTAFALTDSASFDVGEGRPVSIFSPDSSLRIVSEGLKWQTGGVVFDNWWKASLNRASADTVKLVFSHPSMALVVLG